MDLSIKLLTSEEQKYTYTQSSQIISQTGCIGHLRADFGEGESFRSSWDDHYSTLKSPEFKRELDQVINTLRFGPIYVDKHNCIIQDNDVLLYDDGTEEKVFTLEDGSKGHAVTTPDFLKHHQNTKEKFTPLIASPAGEAIRKLHHAEITGLEDADARLNSAFCGSIFASRDQLRKFCYGNPSASFGNDREWGIRADTPHYSYLIRLNPNKGEYSLYCYCYQRDWLDHHIQQARRGIRFISSAYDELFRIPDGDQIRITSSSGEKVDRTVRFIDDTHIEVGASFNNTIYHICEFAERMEQSGCTVVPMRSSLPESCFVYLPTEHAIGLVQKGEEGWYRTDIPCEPSEADNKALVEKLNGDKKVSKAQAAAMSAGSIFGWCTKAADPASYNEDGILQKKTKDRGDAR